MGMTLSEKALMRLKEQADGYLVDVGRFSYNNKEFTIVANYDSWEQDKCFLTCGICGHHPIRDIYVVATPDGEECNVGNECINNIANEKITEYFAKYEKRLTIIKQYSQLIDDVDAWLRDASIRLPQMGRLRIALRAAVTGRKPNIKTVNLYYYYKHKLEHSSKYRRG